MSPKGPDVKSGENTIELEVTNLWPNHLIGDAQPSAGQTYTRTNIRKYSQDSPLLPSGIVGPVTLETVPEAIVGAQESGEAVSSIGVRQVPDSRSRLH